MLEFKAKFNGEEKTFKIKKPGLEESRLGQREYNTTYKNALSSGAILRVKLDQVMKEQGLWSDVEQTKLNQMKEEIHSLEYKLKQKGIKLSEAKKIALKIADTREDIKELQRNWLNMDNNTAEAQSEAAQFNAMIAACILNEDGSKVFNTTDEYLQSTEDDLTNKAATKFLELRYGITEENTTVEYKFLKKYKFVDKDLRLIDKDGNFCDREGRRVDEFGRYINEKNELVDMNGRRVDDSGNYLEDENSYFLDDDGNPILEDEPVKESSPTETEENTQVE